MATTDPRLLNHSNWNHEDYRYLTTKGFKDEEILAIWERDAAMGKPACTQADLTQALARANYDIEGLIERLRLEAIKRSDRLSWETVGSLQHLRQNLIEALESISGVPEAEIKRSLDELHM